MENNDLTDLDEALILQNGLKSDFWAVLQRNFTSWKTIANKELLSPNFEYKSYLAGKVKTLEDVLNFPEVRIKRLEKKK